MSLATPAFAGGRDRYDRGYGNGHGAYSTLYVPAGYRDRGHDRGHRHSGRGTGAAVALIGGMILGAALSKSAQRSETREVVYVEPPYQPACFDRRVTEQTLSGRYVTYTETVCR